MHDSSSSSPNNDDDQTETKTKTILLPTRVCDKKEPAQQHIIRKKVFTQSAKWRGISNDVSANEEIHWLTLRFLISPPPPPPPLSQDSNHAMQTHSVFLIQNINQKISGYRQQDLLKHKFDATKFINVRAVLDLLHSCELKCLYCTKKVFLLYENVREPRQWTLDRIDNDRGHNVDNCCIACLACNLKRRCVFSEKYRFTKQLSVRKLEN